MPFGPIPVVGGAAGVAAFGQDQQAQQIQQQELLTRLIMQAQATQAQREWNQNYKDLQLASLNQNRAAMQQDAADRAQTGRMSLIRQQAEDLPGGTNISGPDFQRIQQAGSGNLFTFKPGQLEGTTIGPSTVGGASTGETQAQDTQTQAAQNLKFTKIPSVKEQEFADSAANRKAQQDFMNALATRKTDISEDQGWQKIGDAMARAQNAPPKGWTSQTVSGPDGKPVIIAVNAGTGESKIIRPPEGSGITMNKPVGATLEARLASAQAVNQTGEDIVRQMSDPAFAKKVGVAMGRFNTLRDFIGNAPQEFGQLAGEIESYSLANMGVHGMRSATGAQKIADLMNQKQTPDSLIGKIKGLNSFSYHFMENEAPGRLKAMGIPSPDTSTGNDIRVGGTYNGKKILSVEPVP